MSDDEGLEDEEKHAAAIVSQLEQMLEAHGDVGTIVVESQFVQTADPELRKRLSVALHECAVRLVNGQREGDQKYVWAAIRMMAVLGDSKDLARLNKFLEPKNARSVRQVSLQAIANVSNRGPQPQIPELAELRDQVATLVRLLCHPEIVAIASPIAICSVVAAVALGLSPTGREAFAAHPLLQRQLDRELEEMTSEWPR
jgi:hypothetical protein